MSYSIKYLASADQDLCDIADYLSRFYESTFKKFMAVFEESILRLTETPFMYEEFHDDSYYRRMVVGDYLIFYHVDDEKCVVEIHRVLHGSRDIKRYITE